MTTASEETISAVWQGMFDIDVSLATRYGTGRHLISLRGAEISDESSADRPGRMIIKMVSSPSSVSSEREKAIIAYLEAHNTILTHEKDGERHYSGWLTETRAYPSYDENPLDELYGEHKYFPPLHAGKVYQRPAMVNVVLKHSSD